MSLWNNSQKAAIIAGLVILHVMLSLVPRETVEGISEEQSVFSVSVAITPFVNEFEALWGENDLSLIPSTIQQEEDVVIDKAMNNRPLESQEKNGKDSNFKCHGQPKRYRRRSQQFV